MPSPRPTASRGDAVRAVRADDRVGADPLAAAEHHGVAGLDRDLHALAHLHPALARRVEQEGIQPPALRHPDDRLVRPVDDSGAVAEPQLDLVDELLDHRRRVDRALPHRAQRHPAAAGLVPREGRPCRPGGRRPPARRAGTRSSIRPAHPRRRSRRSASQTGGYNARAPLGVCPSGQRERAVNPSAQPTEVRILPPPSSSFLGDGIPRWCAGPCRDPIGFCPPHRHVWRTTRGDSLPRWPLPNTRLAPFAPS